MSTSVEVKINPAILIWARETAKYEIDEISDKMDLSSDRIEKWENGKERPTYIQLLDLANYYQRPAMLFFSPKVPDCEPESPPDFRALTNKKISPQITFELRSARARRENLISLEELDEYNFPILNLNKIGENVQLSEKNVNFLADKIRNLLDVSWGQQDALKTPNKSLDFWISQIEKLGILVFQFYGIESKEMRGYAINYKKLPIIGINVKEHPHGKKFTLFHELIHLIIKKEGISNINSFKLKNTVEIFCNKVAAEILVPEKQLLGNSIVKKMNDGTINDKNLTKLSKRFNVSPEVIIRRLLFVDRISSSFFESKQKEWNIKYIAPNYRTNNSKNADEKEKPKTKDDDIKKPKKDPNVSKALKRNGFYYTKLILEAYDNELITSSDLSEYLDEKLQTIDRIKDELSKRGIEK